MPPQLATLVYAGVVVILFRLTRNERADTSPARIDHAFEPLHLEPLFLGRHKYYHFRIWYRRELSSYIKEVLLDARTRSRPYLRGSVLERMVMDHIEGRRNYTNEIHKILTLELIQRHLIEKG